MTMLAVGSMAMGAFSTIQQGKAAEGQAKYQAKVAENNSKIARMQAEDALQRGQVEEQQHRRKVQQMLSTQRTAIAGSGFDLGDETSQDILGDTAMFGEFDALTIRDNAAREAWGFRNQANNYTAEAGMQRAAGANARRMSYISAGTDLLGGASKLSYQQGWGRSSSSRTRLSDGSYINWN